MTIPNSPFISVVILCYNHEKYIGQTIQSVLDQTYSNFELIILDNGSKDSSKKIIESFAEKDQRITFYPFKVNRYTSYGINYLLQKCKGEYITGVAGDDYFKPNKIELQLHYMLDNHLSNSFTWVKAVNDLGESLECSIEKLFNRQFDGNALAEYFTTSGNTLNASTFMFHRSIFEKYGYFDNRMLQTQDYDLWLRIIKHEEINIFPEKLTCYRVRNDGNNLSIQMNREGNLRSVFEATHYMRHVLDFKLEILSEVTRKDCTEENKYINLFEFYQKQNNHIYASAILFAMYDKLGSSFDFPSPLYEDFFKLHSNFDLFKIFANNSEELKIEKKIITYLADPFDTDNYLDLTLNILSPLSNLKDYSIEPLLQKSNGRYHIRTELLAKVHAVIIYDKAAYLSHLIPQIKACGIPVLFYIHTDIWHSDVKHAAKEALDLLQRHYRSCIELADVIVTSNEYLSRDINKANDVITTLVDISPWNELVEKLPRYSDKFTIAVYVDMSNLNDISMITKFIQTIQKKYADELYFVIHAINCPPNELEALSFVDVKMTKINNYIQYINFIRVQPIDAVLTPLIANEHNLTVSPLNYFVQSLCGIPGIYSNWGLYKEVVQHGATGFLCGENELEWEAAVVTLMRHADTREQIAQTARKQVLENFTIDHVLRQTYDLFERFSTPHSPREIPASLNTSFTRYELKSYLNYPQWCENKALQPIDIHVWEALSENWNEIPDFHFFVQADETNLGNLGDTIESFVAQLYPQWNLYIISPLSSPNPLFDEHDKLHWIQTEGSLYSAVNHVSAQMSGGIIGFLIPGDKLQPHALTAYTEIFSSSNCHLVYSDHDSLSEYKNHIHPQFKPDFNLDMFRSKDYISRSFVISSAALKELDGVRLELSDSELFDLILRYRDLFGEHTIGHYSEILHSLVTENKRVDLRLLSSKIALKHHLSRNELNADVMNGVDESFRILYHHESQPLVSIIIPTKNQVHFLHPCIDTILKKTAYKNYEIIIIDNHSDETDAVEYLKSLKKYANIQVIAYNKPFNYSAANNIGAKHAKGDFLLLLNNDTEVLHENWLDVLLSYAQRDDIGIVGPRLIYPNQTIQHAGVILGINSYADHQFMGADLEDPGYMSRLQIDQNLSAVTAAAMLIKRSVFDAVSGLNETDYHVNYSDVDFCLKVVEAGYKVLFTPHATLLHHGSVTQKNIDVKKIKERNKRFSDDQKAFKTRWAEIILHDPAYNINLDTADSFMPIRTQALAHWNPLLKSPIPKILGMARGKDGGGFYRISSPLDALQLAGLAQTHYEYKNFMTTYMMMQQPDIIVYQTPLHDNMLRFLEHAKMYYPKVTLIYEIDDLLTNIPIDNRAFFNQYKDTAKRLMKGLKYCDRLVVSTQPLKDALESYIDDICIIPNYLPKTIWGELQSKRNRSEKLRVGWAGSIFHKGDLAIISKLVESYLETVEWVFFGMVPEGLEGKVEFHTGVSLDQYPEKLASLDLDLALVPLEDNAFNAAKSNLRLLEFGILGWPVICSDVYPYREAPVTRVKNRYKDWEKAFLSKISDLEGLKTEGNQLKKWVEENYMLEDNVDFIYQQYTKPTQKKEV